MKSKRILHRATAALAIAGFVALAAGWDPAAYARTSRYSERFGQFNSASAPLLAIVGLREQRVSIYDATGKILEAPVSSGADGYETPPGIFSIVQKEEDHHSNLYDDASMPFMERITWTGIALHAGVLPGYPASHGCVRLPYEFAEQLYQITNLGMRVVIMREDIAPAEIAQPALFNSPNASTENRAQGSAIMERSSLDNSSLGAPGQMEQLRAIAATKSMEANEAKKREKEARQAAAKRAAEAAQALRTLRGAEANLARAEADLKDAERALATAKPERAAQAEAAKTQAATKLDGAKAQLETTKTLSQAKADAAAQAEEESRAATIAMSKAVEMAVEANHNLSPVSVFVSRKTRRLYIRKGTHPVFEAPVLIRDADKPIGSFVFTALNYNGTSGGMRWNVVSLYKNATNIEPYVQVDRRKAKTSTPPAPADVSAAQAALDRLVVPQEAIDRMSEVVLPGSSLIISDEGPSLETGKDTDFVVLMSGEPAGGMAIRQRSPRRGRDDDDDDFGIFGSRSVSRSEREGERRPSRGGFPFFFLE
jgi:hypothetical protein